MKPWIRIAVLAGTGLVLTPVAGLIVHHATGRAAFQRWKAERVAMGDRLDWKDLVPPEVPEEQNFSLDPLIRDSLVGHGEVDPRFQALGIPEQVSKAALGNWTEGRRDDLEAARVAYGKPSLQAAFAPLEPGFRDLDRASRRPGCRFPVAYEELEMPPLAGFRAAVRTLRLKALLDLRSGHPDLALEDLRICFRISERLKAEPSLLSSLLRVAVLKIAMQVVWEGVEDHLWGAAQLAGLQQDLASIDLLATSRLAWQGERQCLISRLVADAEGRPQPRFMNQEEGQRGRFGPLGRGWRYRNLLAESRIYTCLVDAQDPAAHRVFPAKALEAKAAGEDLRSRVDLVLARMVPPTLVDQVLRFANLQALVDEAGVVCALERYRLERGRYPEGLAELMPVYLDRLPHELVTGGPLHYALAGEGFRLYQAGSDGKDHGGTLAWKNADGKSTLDVTRGDWVWPHADLHRGAPTVHSAPGLTTGDHEEDPRHPVSE